MSQSDDPGRESTPYGSAPQGSPYGQSQQGQPQQGQPQQAQPQYGQSPYGQPQYGQPQYGQPAYGQSPYGRPAYGQPPYGGQYAQQAYGAPAGHGQYGYPAAPSRPGTVVLAAVLGFLFGACGILATLGVFVGGAAVVGLAGALDAGNDPFSGLGEDAAAGIGFALVGVGLVCLAWTVLMIWGSVWALTGRSRVLLLVGGSVAALVTFIGVLASLADTTAGGTGSEYVAGILVTLVFFLAALAIVVPLCLRQAAEFFAAHRARRGR